MITGFRLLLTMELPGNLTALCVLKSKHPLIDKGSQLENSTENPCDIFDQFFCCCQVDETFKVRFWFVSKLSYCVFHVNIFSFSIDLRPKHIPCGHSENLLLPGLSSGTACFFVNPLCWVKNSNSGVLGVYWAYIRLQFVKWNAKSQLMCIPLLIWERIKTLEVELVFDCDEVAVEIRISLAEEMQF